MLPALFIGSLVSHHSRSQLITARILPEIPGRSAGNAIPHLFRHPFILAYQGLEPRAAVKVFLLFTGL
jgi:hypothetical protein